MILHPSQTIIASDIHRFRVVVCGRRFGKSTLDIEEIKGKALVSRKRRVNKLNIPQEEKDKIMQMHAIDDYQCRVDYFAPTFDDARDLIWMPLCRELGPIVIGEPNSTRLELIIRNLDGGKSFIKLRSWENVENFRGKKCDFGVFDEVRKYKQFWLNWEEVIRPTLSDYMGEGLFNTTPNGFDHVYDLYNLENEDQDFKSFHFTSYDNPFLSRVELEKAKQELTEDRFAQEYMADFRKTQGLVYKEFNRDRHLFEEPGFEGQDFVVVKTFGGHDFGTHAPCASITIKKDKDNVYWVTDEWYKRETTDSQQADYVAALRWNECYPDPESASGIEEMRRRGINVRDVIKNKDSVKNGINTVRELFKANRLFISTKCKNLIWELETYSYPERKSDHNEEENPIKENDHALDALRYALSMENISMSNENVHIYHPKFTSFNRR